MNYNKRLRSGLTIIEVLTSIVVAMIGVFGIMVMIPFSVKQSQSGLDRDAATMLARNAMSQIEVNGYRNPKNWMIGTLPTDIVDRTGPQKMFMVDPYFEAENGNAFGNSFPYSLTPSLSPPGNFPYLTPSASLSIHGSAKAPLSLAQARRMFVSDHELIFHETEDEISGPDQILDASSLPAVGNVRRQTRGSLSWAVMMVPYKTSIAATVTTPWSYRSYVIVYKNRNVDSTTEESQMFAANVAHPLTPVDVASPIGSVYLSADVSDPLFRFVPDDYNIAKDSWVMLINRSATAEVGFENQVGFYRVVNYQIDENVGARTLNSITLDGPDFDFGSTGLPADGTQLIHLKDVVAVYERNIVPESLSNWN